MTFKTFNTLYRLQDMGDGAFLIQGHERYCPMPTPCTLTEPVTVGRPVTFTLGSGKVVITTAVQGVQR